MLSHIKDYKVFDFQFTHILKWFRGESETVPNLGYLYTIIMTFPGMQQNLSSFTPSSIIELECFFQCLVLAPFFGHSPWVIYTRQLGEWRLITPVLRCRTEEYYKLSLVTEEKKCRTENIINCQFFYFILRSNIKCLLIEDDGRLKWLTIYNFIGIIIIFLILRPNLTMFYNFKQQT